jgi:hypothetical protein
VRYLVIGMAAAAVAISGPVWAQPAPSTAPPGASSTAPSVPNALPSQMNRMPGGGRATSNRETGSSGTAPATTSPGMTSPTTTGALPHQMNRMSVGGRATSNRGTGPSTRAHHRRHAVESARSNSSGTAADELNRQELSQLQSENPSTMNRMSVGGKATSGRATPQ